MAPKFLLRVAIWVYYLHKKRYDFYNFFSLSYSTVFPSPLTVILWALDARLLRPGSCALHYYFRGVLTLPGFTSQYHRSLLIVLLYEQQLPPSLLFCNRIVNFEVIVSIFVLERALRDTNVFKEQNQELRQLVSNL